MADHWTRILIEDDRRYFAAGARTVAIRGARLMLMGGLEEYPTGAVLLVDDPRAIIDAPARWLEQAAAAARREGATVLRFYTPGEDPALEFALRSTGIESAIELAMAAPAAEVARSSSCADAKRWHIDLVDSADDWARKRSLHHITPERPDGKLMAAEQWVRLEKGKVDAGYMDAYLVEHEGEPAAAFGLSAAPGLLRLKNIVVSPRHRRLGAGMAILHRLAHHAIESGTEMVGLFAIPDSDGLRLYEHCGIATVGVQLEWSLPLSSTSARRNGNETRGAG
jgi:GNAT superfamily N-acetyltransferase